jgi:hypothetical protein
LELSRSKWLAGIGTPQKWTVRRRDVGYDRGQAAAFADELGLQPRHDRQSR